MPQTHKSTIRRARQADRRHERNRATANNVKTLIKKVQSAVAGKKTDEAKTSLLEATSAIGKAVSKGVPSSQHRVPPNFTFGSSRQCPVRFRLLIVRTFDTTRAGHSLR